MRQSTFGKMTDDERKFWKVIADRIYSNRKRVGMTQEQLADKLGISRCQLANIEAGRSRVDAYKMHIIETSIVAMIGDFK